MKDDIKKGFIAPETIAPEEWVLGASNTPKFPVLKEDGNWTNLLPTEERQNIRNIETYNCTGFNTLNPIEILIYQLTGERVNYSDRWVGIIAGTKEPGNDPHKVAEAIREYGLVKEESLPFSDDLKSIDEYYSFKGLSQGQIDDLYEEAKQWKAKYDFKHSWVFTPGQPIIEQINNIKIALKNSPLAVAVFAWASDNRNVYYKNGEENHWTNIYDVKDFIKVFDSYSPFKKDIEQELRYCKRYSVTLKTDEITPEKRAGLLALLQRALEWLGLIQKQVDALPKPVVKDTYEEVKEVLKGRLDEFCLAIRDYEGKPGDLNYRNNNPGNIRGTDGKFLKFNSYEQGFAYLKEYVIRACTGKHKAYPKDPTILQFFKVYAPSSDNNNPEKYAKWIATRMKSTVDTKVSSFL